jgi:DNA helicase-2/ATP-dependent DNA helicase PcrA
MLADDILAALDHVQRRAATSTNPRITVPAGAGTGKTRVLTSRVAHLILSLGEDPSGIVAITFSRKAAREIRERLHGMIGEAGRMVGFGTFHAFAARIVRRHADLCGLRDARFAVADEDESRTLVVEAVRSAGTWPDWQDPPRPADMADKAWETFRKARRKEWELAFRSFVAAAETRIMRWKECGVTVEAALVRAESSAVEEDRLHARTYAAYQDALERRNLADFPDLVLKAVTLLETHADILVQESGAIRHLLIDEAQDTNPAQKRLIELLSSVNGHLFLVGDDDQSMYMFRCASRRIMSELREGSQVVVLEANRRSTDQILSPANALVARNPRDVPKVLRSGKSGAPVEVKGFDSEYQEAGWIAKRIRSMIDQGAEPSSIACLFRAGFTMRPTEEALLRSKVPYVLVGGTPLLAREEVKDLMAYVKLAVDPMHDLAFRRVVNKPTRGLGPAAEDILCSTARSNGIPFHSACQILAGSAIGPRLRQEARNEAAGLGGLLQRLADLCRRGGETDEIVEAALKGAGYVEWLRAREDGAKRLANVEAIRIVARMQPDPVVFLQEYALVDEADPDPEAEEQSRGKVRLSTIHAAKGLEFDTVFCPAFEKNVIPSLKSQIPGADTAEWDSWDGPPTGGLEEERRIAHVAFTRAKSRLVVTWSARRSNTPTGGASQFLSESGLLGRVETAPASTVSASKGFFSRVRA